MIDPTTENLISLRQAAKLHELCRDGRAPHIATLWRWVQTGRLDSILIGGLRMTSREAVMRMIRAQNGGAVVTTSPATRDRELARLERELVAAGI